MKPSNYEKSKTRKYNKDMKYRNSLIHDEKQDKYLSSEEKDFIQCKDRQKKIKSGNVSITKVYSCFNWDKNGQKTKGIYISETFQRYREMSFNNITSKEGIEDRLNRSI